ncbi:helix-turn-helix domain-containing protein [Microcella alkalica]|uniref:helix-turn-helix domain-containing protein n=1 Tax=Microcella alkalica TaxID=355930 RepID=UPI001B7CE5D8|nr:cupin domain-containing protein [Microcella alkalica]
MASDVRIGARLRAARLARGLTLEAVGAAAGISQGFVSKLERDQVSPSVASLVAICEAVGLKVGELFEPPPSQIVRAGEGAPINFGGEGAEEFLLTPGTQTDVEVIRSIIDPGGTAGDDLYSLDCDVEFVYVLRGRLTIILGDDEHELAAGDSMTFRGRDPHTWHNASAEEGCEVLWVLAPAT